MELGHNRDFRQQDKMNRHNRNKTLKTTYNTILISRLKYKNLNKIIKHKQFQRYKKSYLKCTAFINYLFNPLKAQGKLKTHLK